MDNLRLFETEFQHETAQRGFEYPTVSYVTDTDIVYYMKKSDYNKVYLTFKALEDGTFSFTMPSNVTTSDFTDISYSIDGGNTWVTENNVDSTEVTITTPIVKAGKSVLWKGHGKRVGINNTMTAKKFSSTAKFNIMGNVMSLLYGDDFVGKTQFVDNIAWIFSCLFYNTKVVSAKDLLLPVTDFSNLTGSARPYYAMFYNCTLLVDAPELPATSLCEGCYWDMFCNCKLLTTAPELPATSITKHCYREMFNSCSSLTKVPDLLATSPTQACYRGMFAHCSSLIETPDIKLTSLSSESMYDMFNGCTKLENIKPMSFSSVGSSGLYSAFNNCISLEDASQITIKALSSTKNCYSMFWNCGKLKYPPQLTAVKLTNQCYERMFCRCSSLTTPPDLPATTLASSCYKTMFDSCTSLETAPSLPVTTLVDNCYNGMFYNCKSLTTAPELPATTLVSNCYSSMFYGCSNLNYIKAMFTTTPSTDYTNSWVNGVASTGTFVKNSAAQWDVTGTSGVPTGWTVETASA